MPPVDHLLAFTITCAIVILIPGPSVLFTVGRALSLGRRGALLTVLGNSAGLCVQIVLVAFGLGALVAESAAAFTAVKTAGALYLLWLGVQAIRHRRAWTRTAPAAAGPPQRARRILAQGFVVGATNPKMIVFLTAALPQFVGPGSVAPQMLALGAIVVVIAVTCDSMWAMAAGTARAWFARSPRRIETMSGAGGVAMIGLGATFLVAGGRE